jgi:hypothetical protein
MLGSCCWSNYGQCITGSHLNNNNNKGPPVYKADVWVNAASRKISAERNRQPLTDAATSKKKKTNEKTRSMSDPKNTEKGKEKRAQGEALGERKKNGEGSRKKCSIYDCVN